MKFQWGRSKDFVDNCLKAISPSYSDVLQVVKFTGYLPFNCFKNCESVITFTTTVPKKEVLEGLIFEVKLIFFPSNLTKEGAIKDFFMMNLTVIPVITFGQDAELIILIKPIPKNEKMWLCMDRRMLLR